MSADCAIPNHGCGHSCYDEGCFDDPTTADQIWSSGEAAYLNGVPYEDCPYGHHHPDVRFNAWVRGWYHARRESTGQHPPYCRCDEGEDGA